MDSLNSKPADPMQSESWRGRTASRTVTLTREAVDAFAALSGDTSPIHMRDEAASARGFHGRVVHGLLLGALVSGVVGTELPGADGVLQEVRLSFHNPCYIGDRVRIELAVDDYIESVRALRLKVRIENAEGKLLAKGTVQSGLVPAT